MSVTRVTKNRIFFILLFAAGFGLFILYLSWVILKLKPLHNPPGHHYVIRYVPHPLYPHAVFYDFEPPLPREVPTALSDKGHSLIAAGEGGMSAVINMPLGNYSPEQCRKIGISTWLKAGSSLKPPDAEIGILITNSLNDVVFSRRIRIRPPEPEAGWFMVQTALETSGYQWDADHRLRILMINHSEDSLLLDNLSVFFSPSPRPGDSGQPLILPYDQAQFNNTPPYPPFMMRISSAGYSSRPCLAYPDSRGQGYFFNDEPLYCGNFLKMSGQGSQLIYLTPGRMELYYRKPGERGFLSLQIPCAELTAELTGLQYYPADLDGNGTHELVALNKDSLLCLIAEPGIRNKAGLKINRYGVGMMKASGLFPADLVDGKEDEVLISDSRGNWKIYRIRNHALLTVAESQIPLEWFDEESYQSEFLIIPVSGNHDQVLIISEKKKESGKIYSLLKYQPTGRTFVPAFRTADGRGVWTGTDTLGLKDKYWAVDLVPGGRWEVLRKREDWRYDLVVISLSDSAYHVTGRVDFPPELMDENPKYYEYFRIFPANLDETGRWGLLVMCGNLDPLKPGKVLGVKTEYYVPGFD